MPVTFNFQESDTLDSSVTEHSIPHQNIDLNNFSICYPHLYYKLSSLLNFHSMKRLVVALHRADPHDFSDNRQDENSGWIGGMETQKYSTIKLGKQGINWDWDCKEGCVGHKSQKI